jgi:hypothetical protein
MGFYFIFIVVLFIFVIQYSENFFRGSGAPDSRDFGFVHGGLKLRMMMMMRKLRMMMMKTIIISIKSLVARRRGDFGCDV